MAKLNPLEKLKPAAEEPSRIGFSSRRSKFEQIIENSTIHIDAAACIRWSFLGFTVLILVIASIFTGQTAEISSAVFSLLTP